MYNGINDANQESLRYIIKRSGKQELFAADKVRKAIESANNEEIGSKSHLNNAEIDNIVDIVTNDVYNATHALNVEDIQDIIERELNKRSYNVFIDYHDYRARHAEARSSNELDKKIEAIIDVRVNDDGTVSCQNEVVKQENSNKNPTVLSVQRDYIAGEWSRHYMRDHVLPAYIQQAHDQGIIHFHDTDYTSMHMHNCDLVNLNDMLQNGTKISGTLIERPKSFATACTVMSQIAAGVASSQYGGQSMSLAHIAPFVDVSRQKLRNRYSTEWLSAGIQFTTEQLNNVVESELRKEVEAGCQTIQYQLITLHSTNGQAPFITLNMWLDEAPEGQTRDDLALIIEVMLEQRMTGIKDEKGNSITIAFPKLIYVLDEDNAYEGSKYYYLTKLAAQCTSKRMVPDYVSAKIMRKYKLSKGEEDGSGDVYPPMGCLDYNERIEVNNHSFKIGDVVETIDSLYENKEFLKGLFKYKGCCCLSNFSNKNSFLNIVVTKEYDSARVLINGGELISDLKSFINDTTKVDTGKSVKYDLPDGLMEITSHNRQVGLKSVLYNRNVMDWMEIKYKLGGYNTRSIILTSDHPLPLSDGKVYHASELKVGDKLIRVDKDSSLDQYAEITEINIINYCENNSYDVTTDDSYFDINGEILSHNCRSFLTPDRSGNGYDNVAKAKDWTPTPKYYGRFNQGVVTINLPDVALSSHKDMDRFWEILNDRLELCHRALQIRHNSLVGTPSDVAPLLWQDGALARLKPGETIDKLLYGGYSTISLGYAGLYECVKYMTGLSHTDPMARPFALAIMQKLNDKCAEWKQAEDIDYSVYGTPLESTTYKFAKCLQRRFGIIEGITDHNYITNSYHVCVREKIDAFTKLKFESEFQRLSPGGAISYVEVPNMQNNIEAVLRVMQFIYENIMYAELNTKSDVCEVCGYNGEIKIVKDEHGKLVWECPNCGNRDQNKMVVARRTCGYIGTNFWNQGRTAEIHDRVLHL